MNKAELIEVVAARLDASKKDTAQAVQAVVEAIQEAVAKGQKVSISGFGVFEKAARPARTYRKPSTGEAIKKVATAVPKFRPGGDFKAFVSGEKSIASTAVKAARDAGDDVIDAAESVVRRVTGRPATEPAGAPASATEPAAPSAPAASAAPAAARKATAARKTTAAKATTGTTGTARSTAAKKAAAGTAKAPARAPRAAATPAAPAASSDEAASEAGRS